MYKHIASIVLGAALVITPVGASAAALSEAQIQSVLTLLSAFGVEQSVITTVTSALRGQPVTPAQVANVCAEAKSLAAGLGVGYTGTAVSELQRILAQDRAIYPEGLVTGYYGSLTVAALERCNKGAPSTPTTPGATPSFGAPSCTWQLQNSNPDPGEEFTISWTSKNVNTVTDSDGKMYLPNDKVTYTATTPGTFEYPFTFKGAGGSVICRVSVTVSGTTPPAAVVKPVAAGSIATDAISATMRALKGTAANTSEVLITISEDGSLFTSGKAIVVSGEWSYTSALPFMKGRTYTVYLYGYPTTSLIVKKDLVAE